MLESAAAMNRFVPALTALLVFPAALGISQEQPKVTFHVTSVKQDDAKDHCTDGKCSATRVAVEGYTRNKDENTAVEYVLECIEVMPTEPKQRATVRCPRVHANTDYLAKIGADFVRFEDNPTSDDKEVYEGMYAIKREGEVRK